MWRNVEPPALLLFGDQSPVVTAAEAADLARLNPRADVIPVTGCGHMIPWDNLDQTAREIESFVSKHGASGS